MRVCLVSGSPQAGRCGIHDYALTLSKALRRQGLDAEILDHRDWSVGGTLRLAKRLHDIDPDLVQMQYPMIVGWRSLGPHATGFLSAIPQVVTLHEFSSFDRLRRASLGAFAARASKLVLTTDFEAARFLSRFPRARAKTSVIPIGSNVPFRPRTDRTATQRNIIYFGQIKPLKGLEQFVELVELATARQRPWTFQVVGAPVTWAGDYLAEMQRRLAGTRTEWLLDRGDDEAADLLAGASAAYLPYPDGVSERRGSLIAALGNGVPVVTTHGEFEPTDIGETVLFAADAAQAEARIEALLEDGDATTRLRDAGPRYVERFSWDRIAANYHAIYSDALRAHDSRRSHSTGHQREPSQHAGSQS